jgi:hypothetical protein
LEIFLKKRFGMFTIFEQALAILNASGCEGGGFSMKNTRLVCRCDSGHYTEETSRYNTIP